MPNNIPHYCLQMVRSPVLPLSHLRQPLRRLHLRQPPAVSIYVSSAVSIYVSPPAVSIYVSSAVSIYVSPPAVSIYVSSAVSIYVSPPAVSIYVSPPAVSIYFNTGHKATCDAQAQSSEVKMHVRRHCYAGRSTTKL